jgi:hypothetical protein
MLGVDVIKEKNRGGCHEAGMRRLCQPPNQILQKTCLSHNNVDERATHMQDTSGSDLRRSGLSISMHVVAVEMLWCCDE